MKLHAKLLEKVSRLMRKLSSYYDDNNLFVSQLNDEEIEHASVIISLSKDNSDDDEYLKLRRLFKALEYRFNQEIKDYKIKVSIERKERR